MVALVSKSILGMSADDPTYRKFGIEISQGRAIKLTIPNSSGDKFLLIYAVHNFDLSATQMSRLDNMIRGDITLSNNQPDTYCVVLVGDMNIEPEGVERISVARPRTPKSQVSNSGNDHLATNTWGHDEGTSQIGPNYAVRSNMRKFQSLFKCMTEIRSNLPTHYSHQGLYLNTIDRVFTSAPRSILAITCNKSGVIKDPSNWFGRELSDHAPIFWTVSAPKIRKRENMRLRPEWCAHPRYRQRLQALCDAAKINEVPLVDRRGLLLDYMRDAAVTARDHLFKCDPRSQDNDLLRLGTISRAVWSGDAFLARILVTETDLGRDHLKFVNGDVPSLSQPANFENALRLAKESFHQREQQSLAQQAAKQRRKGEQGVFRSLKTLSKLEASERLATLWRPKGAKLQSHGLRISWKEATDWRYNRVHRHP